MHILLRTTVHMTHFSHEAARTYVRSLIQSATFCTTYVSIVGRERYVLMFGTIEKTPKLLASVRLGRDIRTTYIA